MLQSVAARRLATLSRQLLSSLAQPKSTRLIANSCKLSSNRLACQEHSNCSRSSYKHFVVMETRWMDNDIYGHVYWRSSLFSNCLRLTMFSTIAFLTLLVCSIFCGCCIVFIALLRSQYISSPALVNRYLIQNGGLDIHKAEVRHMHCIINFSLACYLGDLR